MGNAKDVIEQIIKLILSPLLAGLLGYGVGYVLALLPGVEVIPLAMVLCVVGAGSALAKEILG